MRQMRKPALVQNETNAKATNNNFTQKSQKSQKGESQAIHRRQIIILSPRNSRNRRNGCAQIVKPHTEITEITEILFATQIFGKRSISAISAISAGHKKDLRAQHFCDFRDFCVTLYKSEL